MALRYNASVPEGQLPTISDDNDDSGSLYFAENYVSFDNEDDHSSKGTKQTAVSSITDAEEGGRSNRGHSRAPARYEMSSEGQKRRYVDFDMWNRLCMTPPRGEKKRTTAEPLRMNDENLSYNTDSAISTSLSYTSSSEDGPQKIWVPKKKKKKAARKKPKLRHEDIHDTFDRYNADPTQSVSFAYDGEESKMLEEQEEEESLEGTTIRYVNREAHRSRRRLKPLTFADVIKGLTADCCFFIKLCEVECTQTICRCGECCSEGSSGIAGKFDGSEYSDEMPYETLVG